MQLVNCNNSVNQHQDVLSEGCWLYAVKCVQALRTTTIIHMPAVSVAIKYCHHCTANAVQASVSAETAPWDGKRSKLKGVRKIHPSQPPGASLNIQACIPPAVAAAAYMPSHDSSSQDSVKEKLQEAFLEQYSGAEHKARHHHG
jgi:hypothetical protein